MTLNHTNYRFISLIICCLLVIITGISASQQQTLDSIRTVIRNINIASQHHPFLNGQLIEIQDCKQYPFLNGKFGTIIKSQLKNTYTPNRPMIYEIEMIDSMQHTIFVHEKSITFVPMIFMYGDNSYESMQWFQSVLDGSGTTINEHRENFLLLEMSHTEVDAHELLKPAPGFQLGSNISRIFGYESSEEKYLYGLMNIADRGRRTPFDLLQLFQLSTIKERKYNIWRELRRSMIVDSDLFEFVDCIEHILSLIQQNNTAKRETLNINYKPAQNIGNYHSRRLNELLLYQMKVSKYDDESITKLEELIEFASKNSDLWQVFCNKIIKIVYKEESIDNDVYNRYNGDQWRPYLKGKRNEASIDNIIRFMSTQIQFGINRNFIIIIGRCHIRDEGFDKMLLDRLKFHTDIIKSEEHQFHVTIL